MAKKEISIFSVSFLDLLSGALAAVIILFVVIPKMTHEQADAIETLDKMEVQMEELEDLIELARNSIPEELYEQIQQQLESMRETMNQLQEEVTQLAEDLRTCEEERERLQLELDQTRQQLQEALEQIPVQSENQGSGQGQVLFGVDAKFAIVITWPDNLDVDLHIKNTSNGEFVNYKRKNMNRNWGNLLTDITQRREGEDIYELFFQKQIVPGTYEVYYHLYTETNQSVDVNGYVVMHPNKPEEFRIDLPQKRISHTARDVSGLIKIGTIRLNQDNFSFN